MDGQWKIESPGGVIQGEDKKLLPYVSPWKSFSKLDEAEKERIFNAIRGAVIASGMMENKG